MITEKEARKAKAGPETDRFCDEWMGRDLSAWPENMRGKFCRPYTSLWQAAGDLLEVLDADLYFEGGQYYCHVNGIPPVGDKYPESANYLVTWAGDRKLALARACLVLVARGITLEQLKSYRKTLGDT